MAFSIISAYFAIRFMQIYVFMVIYVMLIKFDAEKFAAYC